MSNDSLFNYNTVLSIIEKFITLTKRKKYEFRGIKGRGTGCSCHIYLLWISYLGFNTVK